MKRVSFEVAKAIKEAGYPQGNEDTAYYNENGMLVKPCVFNGGKEIADAPTYMEVWVWLWREKKIWIQAMLVSKRFLSFINEKPFGELTYDDPEEAIEKAIVYLVENNMII